MKTLTLWLSLYMMCAWYSPHLFAQKTTPIQAQLLQYQPALKAAPFSPLVQPLPGETVEKMGVSAALSDAGLMKLSAPVLEQLRSSRPDVLKLKLPAPGGKTLTLLLYRADVLRPGFLARLGSQERGEESGWTPGVYYWGGVEGRPGSLAALALNTEEVMGLLSLEGGNYTLGALEGRGEGVHALFAEADMRFAPDFDCMVDDEEHFIGSRPQVGQQRMANPDNCVGMYVEIDNSLVQAKGGPSQAMDYVAGAFSQVAAVYANESVNLQISELVAWDVADPYNGPSTSNFLVQFRDELGGDFNGDLAHLVGTQGSGGIAYLDVLCNGFYSVGYSDINLSYNAVPAYSWTVNVLAHEIGHNLGSRHTHACVWNGNNTPLDCCGYASGYEEASTCGANYSCNTPLPDVGTVMSYCHITSGVGISLNPANGGGFGQQPGDLIRDKVYNAFCLSSCGDGPVNDAALTGVVVPNGAYCSGSLSPRVTLQNVGAQPLQQVTINYQIDEGVVNTYAWSGNLSQGAATSVSLPVVAFGIGGHTFEAWVSSPNGTTDDNPANDNASSFFTRLA
ncbi:M12 family metallo-peptidase, partial [Phaeodactylibacter luteus]